MHIPLYQIDAFTSRVFAGNPAAVCPLDAWPDDALLQSIAAENNLSETAFFVPGEDGYALRWFTPVAEVDLCGHATLASAHVILRERHDEQSEVRFHTRSGVLTVVEHEDLLEMDFPARAAEATAPPKGLLEALGLAPREVLRSEDYLVVYDSEDQILGIEPDFRLLAALDVRGVIVTAPGNHCDFASRFFAPAVGIDEDPVTGSAHTTLTPYWSERLGKPSLHAKQVSQRGGELWCTDRGERVVIAGRAVTFMQGEIAL